MILSTEESLKQKGNKRKLGMRKIENEVKGESGWKKSENYIKLMELSQYQDPLLQPSSFTINFYPNFICW